jgi:hypothetical protein
MSSGGESPSRRPTNNNNITNKMNDRNDFTKKERVGGGMSEGPVDESYARFLKNLLKERESLDPEKYPATLRIVQCGKRVEFRQP